MNFIHSTAKHGGPLCALSLYVLLSFADNSMANFSNNSVYGNGGAAKFVENCILMFTGNSTAKFVAW